MSDEADDSLMDRSDVKAEMRAQQARASADPYERWAGELLWSMLGASQWIVHDDGTADAMHDFDLEFREGYRFAVEVTSDTAGRSRVFYSLRDRDCPIKAPTLKWHWDVGVRLPGRDPHDAAAIHQQSDGLKTGLEPLLAQAEQEGIARELRSVDVRFGTREEHPLVGALRSLGVSYAWRGELARDATIWINEAPAVTPSDPEAIADAIDVHLPQNRAKLMAAKRHGAREAHLFLWLPAGTGVSESANLALRSGADRSEAPREIDLQGLDSVWVATDLFTARSMEIHGYAQPIWQFDRDGWQRWERRWWYEQVPSISPIEA